MRQDLGSVILQKPEPGGLGAWYLGGYVPGSGKLPTHSVYRIPQSPHA